MTTASHFNAALADLEPRVGRPLAIFSAGMYAAWHAAFAPGGCGHLPDYPAACEWLDLRLLYTHGPGEPMREGFSAFM